MTKKTRSQSQGLLEEGGPRRIHLNGSFLMGWDPELTGFVFTSHLDLLPFFLSKHSNKPMLLFSQRAGGVLMRVWSTVSVCTGCLAASCSPAGVCRGPEQGGTVTG